MFKDDLVAAMEKEGLTTSDLADLVGVSYATAWKWVSGKTVPRAETKAKIEEIFGEERPPKTERVFSGVRLLEKREQYGYSKKALGKLIGASDVSIYNWESGACQPSVVNVRALCSVFGLKEDYFYKTITKKESREDPSPKMGLDYYENNKLINDLSNELDGRIEKLTTLVRDYAAKVEELEEVIDKLERHDNELKTRFDDMARTEQFKYDELTRLGDYIDDIRNDIDDRVYDPLVVRALATAVLKGGAA